VIYQYLLNNIRLQLIDARSKLNDRILTLFVDKNSHITKLQISIDDYCPGIFIIQRNSQINRNRCNPVTPFNIGRYNLPWKGQNSTPPNTAEDVVTRRCAPFTVGLRHFRTTNSRY
jgi:hypothetical protein